ncbi:MAG: rhodanese-like domain-containing protein [Meiothermus sp.]|uniref:rhodanese-like domain-containing protein n=1 Tax=Meiothermus sp. TaxID=1955249 RepID=UPI0025DA3A87|nr:rhodanese-like domain-containing protein [Meiothermus sp.]MCS7069404.1 rhodanese-like domain-containing protein [Meiothermus sp.]MCX7740865.1 rhodanese-like domain-containing protein [Meiothermus sp.]MDW8425903.1 rhodanese-like domain-containing protein [Meiothermus sp.]
MRLLTLLLALFSVGMAQPRIVTVDDLKAALSNPKVFVIDVRTREEFAQGHIKGAVNWPVQEIEGWWSRVPKDRAVYIHCNTQNRSAVAVQYLINKGYRNLNLVHGGIQAWMARRYPITR